MCKLLESLYSSLSLTNKLLQKITNKNYFVETYNTMHILNKQLLTSLTHSSFLARFLLAGQAELLKYEHKTL